MEFDISELKRGKKISPGGLLLDFMLIEGNDTCGINQGSSMVKLESDRCGCFAAWADAFLHKKDNTGDCKHGIARLIRRFYLPEMRFRKIRETVIILLQGSGDTFGHAPEFDSVSIGELRMVRDQCDATDEEIKEILKAWKKLSRDLHEHGAPEYPFGTDDWENDPSDVINSLICAGTWK